MDIKSKEVWVPIPGYESHYEISNHGRIRRMSELRHRHTESSGYQLVKLSKNGRSKTHRLHVLVAMAFHGERPPGMVIDHIDGDKRNSCADNLQYLTQSEHVRKHW